MSGVSVVTEIAGKTEQHIRRVITALQRAGDPLTYDDLRIATGGKRLRTGVIKGGTSYDVLLYILHTLVEVDLVEKTTLADGPGRPRVYFRWIGPGGARAMGARQPKT